MGDFSLIKDHYRLHVGGVAVGCQLLEHHRITVHLGKIVVVVEAHEQFTDHFLLKGDVAACPFVVESALIILEALEEIAAVVVEVASDLVGAIRLYLPCRL